MGNPIDRLLQEQARKNPIDELLQTQQTPAPAQAERPGGIRRVVNITGNTLLHPGQIMEQSRNVAPLRDVANVLTSRARRFFTEQLPNLAVAVTQPGSPQQAETVQQIGGAISGLIDTATQSVQDYVQGIRDAQGFSTLNPALPNKVIAAAKPVVTLPLALVDMLVAPVADAAEAATGLNLSDNFGTVLPLTAEQNANAIQSTAANIAGLVSGLAIERSIATKPISSGISEVAAKGASNASSEAISAAAGGVVPSPSLRSAVVSGAAGGAGGGAVFGLTEQAGRDELIPAVVAYTIAGGALGTALNVAIHRYSVPTEPIVNGKPISQVIAEAQQESSFRARESLRQEVELNSTSGEIAGQARQMNQTEATTLQDGIASAVGMNTSADDLAQAVVTKGLMTPGRTIIEGVSPKVAGKIANISRANDVLRLRRLGFGEEQANFIAHQRELGTITGRVPLFKEVQALYDNAGIDFNANALIGAEKDVPIPESFHRGSTVYLHQTPERTYRVLLNNDVAPLTETQIQSFRKYGYLPGEQVSFNGKNYTIVRPGDANGVNMVVSDGVNEVLLNRNEILSTQYQVLTPELVSKHIEEDFVNFLTQDVRNAAKARGQAPATPPIKSTKVHDFKISQRYAKSAPKFNPPGRKGAGAIPIEFASDFDRVAYILGSKSGKPETKSNLLGELGGVGVRKVEDVTAHAAQIRQRLKDLYAQNPKIDKIRLSPTPFYGEQKIPSSTLDAAIGEVTTAKSFSELVADYGKMLFIEDPAALKSLEADLGQRLSTRLDNLLDPAEREVINSVNKEVQQTLAKSRENAKFRDVDAFVINAAQNGIYIEKGSPGVYILRDITSGKEIGRGSNIRKLNDFINKSRQTTGVSIDGGSNAAGVPPLNNVNGRMVNGDSPTPFNIVDDSHWLNSLRENPIFGDIAPVLTKTADYFATLDRKFGTKLLERVYRRIQNGAVEPLIAERRALDKQIHHFNDLLGKRTQSRRELIFDFIETDSPENIIANGVRKGTPLNPEQVRWAQSLAKHDNNKQIQLAVLANRGMQGRMLDASPAQVTKLQGQYQILLTELGINPQQAKIVDALAQSRMNNLEIRDIFVLTEAYKGDGVRPSMNKADFAKFHEMTPEEVNIAKRISTEYFDKLAQERELNSQLNNYITHRRVTWEVPDTWRKYEELVGDETAYFELSRQGLLDVFEKDPIRAMQQYAYAHLYTKYIVPAVKDASAALTEELSSGVKGLGTVAPEIEARANSYFRDLQGMRTASDKRWTTFGGHVFEKLGIPDGRVTVERFKATLDSAFQGARISAGIRDYVAGVINYYPAFGSRRAGRFAKMVYTLSDEEITRLVDQGKIIDMGLSSIETPIEGTLGERLAGEGARKLNAINRAALQASGQPWVYRRVQAAAYTETFDTVAKALVDYRKTGNQKALVKAIDLDFYDLPQRQQFAALLDSGLANADQVATEYLANETRGMFAGRYGFGNNPQGWTSIEGRLAGHYGQWTIQHKSYVLKLLTNGEGWGGRYKRMARYAVANGALLLSKPLTGINLAFYAPLLGLGFSGGPALTTAMEVGGAVKDALQGNTEAGERFVESALPWNNRWRHAYIPGSYAASDYFTAADMTGEGDYGEALAALNRITIDE